MEVNTQQESAATCPECGTLIQFGLLMPDDDDVWRVSRFAGRADDVTVVRPPGGGVAYGPGEAARTQAPGCRRQLGSRVISSIKRVACTLVTWKVMSPPSGAPFSAVRT